MCGAVTTEKCQSQCLWQVSWVLFTCFFCTMYNKTVKSDWFFVWLLFHLTEAQAVPVTRCPVLNKKSHDKFVYDTHSSFFILFSLQWILLLYIPKTHPQVKGLLIYIPKTTVLDIYYIKVSGIASGNKLIKTIRYPHMWRYDIFTCEDIDDFGDIKFVS